MIGKLIAGWVIDYLLKAVARWLTARLGKPSAAIEQLPDDHPDAAPSPAHTPKRQPKYPVDTRPGHFNRETGTFNP